jgi:hypothetical protein
MKSIKILMIGGFDHQYAAKLRQPQQQQQQQQEAGSAQSLYKQTSLHCKYQAQCLLLLQSIWLVASTPYRSLGFDTQGCA